MPSDKDNLKKPNDASTSSADALLEDEFGLHALHDILSMKYSDLTALSLGYDIQSLGMQFGAKPKDPSKDKRAHPTHPEGALYATFRDPWDTSSSAAQTAPLLSPAFQPDPSHAVQRTPLRLDQLAALHVDTLFYIFYTYPRDVAQIAAAAELYRRKWAFDTSKRLWFLSNENANKAKPPKKETVAVFDPETWSTENHPAADFSAPEGANPVRDFTVALRSMSGGAGHPPVSFGFGSDVRNVSGEVHEQITHEGEKSGKAAVQSKSEAKRKSAAQGR